VIGKTGFQETDFYGLTLPIVKHSYLVMNVEDIRVSSKRLSHRFHRRPGRSSLISQGRQQSSLRGRVPGRSQLRGYNPEKKISEPAIRGSRIN